MQVARPASFMLDALPDDVLYNIFIFADERSRWGLLDAAAKPLLPSPLA